MSKGTAITLDEVDDTAIVELLRDFQMLHSAWTKAIIAGEPDLGPHERVAQRFARRLLAVFLGREPTAQEIERVNGTDVEQ